MTALVMKFKKSQITTMIFMLTPHTQDPRTMFENTRNCSLPNRMLRTYSKWLEAFKPNKFDLYMIMSAFLYTVDVGVLTYVEWFRGGDFVVVLLM